MKVFLISYLFFIYYLFIFFQNEKTFKESISDGKQIKAFDGNTGIFIFPGYRFRVVDVLVTNFHLPRSTLLMLVYAFGGMEQVRAAYEYAIERKFRFYSYGDAMCISRECYENE